MPKINSSKSQVQRKKRTYERVKKLASSLFQANKFDDASLDAFLSKKKSLV